MEGSKTELEAKLQMRGGGMIMQPGVQITASLLTCCVITGK